MRTVRFAIIFLFILILCSCGGLPHYAKTGNIAGAKESLANGADINWRSTTGNTPLIIAAGERNNGKMVELLCSSKGVDINARNMHGATALLVASYYNHVDSVEALIKCKADKTIPDMWGRTPLSYAEQYEYTRIIALLKN